MRRAGGLWGAVMERGNWVRAFHQAARGRRWRPEVRAFGADLDGNVDRVRDAVGSGRFAPGRFEVFRVFDPKERVIHAAPFEERVFQHALMNVCEPVLEARAVEWSCACRRGKGQPAVVRGAERGARGYAWYLKLDIRKYFESVPHGLLWERLEGVFKDPRVLEWLGRIVRSHHAAPGRGLPIGSLTSQHLANFYLGTLDRFCTEHAAVGRYVRYMDDFVCWGRERQAMRLLGVEIEAMVRESLGLALKHPPCPQPTARGMDFLGYRIFPSHTGLSRRSKVRYARKVRLVGRLHEEGRLTERAVQERLTALVAFTLPVRAAGFRGRVHGRMGSTVIGHEPGDPWRELEQQRGELRGGEPEQQQPDQQQQQQRVPAGSELRPAPSGSGGAAVELNRPSSGSRAGGRDKRWSGPSGAGSSAAADAKVPGGPILFDEAMEARTGLRGSIASNPDPCA